MATKRGAAADAVDDIPSKRQRIQEEAALSSSLDYINGDCVLLILKYLLAEDLNSVAVCSRRYRDARSHESLDQTRTGSIVCSENTNLETIRTASFVQQWNRVFTGNRTRLKIVGLERMPAVRDFYFKWPPLSHLLLNVSSLVIKPLSGNRTIQHSKNIAAVVGMVPNLDEIDLGRMIVQQDARPTSPLSINNMLRACQSLRRFSWNAAPRQAYMYLDGSNFTHNPIFTEYYLDECHLVTSHPDARERFSVEEAPARPNLYLFRHCPHLERISIKNVTWSSMLYTEGLGAVEEVPQEMIIKMARHHPTLRWLRSDLTEENISMLQKERPEITFISE